MTQTVSSTPRVEKVERCRSCKAEVVFVPSAKTGKAMILDAAPRKGVVLFNGEVDPGDNLGLTLMDGYLVDDPASRDAKALVLDVYTDHHVTCPDSERWKGRHR